LVHVLQTIRRYRGAIAKSPIIAFQDFRIPHFNSKWRLRQQTTAWLTFRLDRYLSEAIAILLFARTGCL
jgi:outer membrane scaffolding protein for murein synthesis (MipA/OmpV family)